jgi:hypothetical protein
VPGVANAPAQTLTIFGNAFDLYEFIALHAAHDRPIANVKHKRELTS